MSDLKETESAGDLPAETPQVQNPADGPANEGEAGGGTDDEQQLPPCIRKRVVELRRLIATHSAEEDIDAQKRITVVMDAFITEVCVAAVVVF